MKAAVLLLGDSRSRFLFAEYGPRVCRPMSCDSSAYCAQATALWPRDNRWSAGAAACSSSNNLTRMGYYAHMGVALAPPYWHNPSHYHDFFEPNGNQTPPTSLDLMLHAVHEFQQSLPLATPVVVVFSSFMWDLARKWEYFPQQSDDDWLHEYEANLTTVAHALKRNLQGHNVVTSHAHQLVVVADYGCWATPPASPFCAHAHHNSSKLDLLVERAAAAVTTVANRMGLPLVNLAPIFQKRWRALVLEEGEGHKYHHPNSAGCSVEWAALVRLLPWLAVPEHTAVSGNQNGTPRGTPLMKLWHSSSVAVGAV